jgi:hypothetical protein
VPQDGAHEGGQPVAVACAWRLLEGALGAAGPARLAGPGPGAVASSARRARPPHSVKGRLGNGSLPVAWKAMNASYPIHIMSSTRTTAKNCARAGSRMADMENVYSEGPLEAGCPRNLEKNRTFNIQAWQVGGSGAGVAPDPHQVQRQGDREKLRGRVRGWILIC